MIMMFRLVFSAILCFFVLLQSEAQDRRPPERRVIIRDNALGNDQVQVERIAYFTEQIGLTTEEAQLFWPVYNEMDNKRNVLFEERASIIKKFMNESNSLSDKQINELLNRLTAIQKQEMALPAEYDAKLRKVLPARKVMNLYVAEMGFRKYLLQKRITLLTISAVTLKLGKVCRREKQCSVEKNLGKSQTPRCQTLHKDDVYTGTLSNWQVLSN
jgi:hypothetical protein